MCLMIGKLLIQKSIRGLLRKEVIQPQVPLRLPCYDLVPIRSFIFGTNLVWRLRMPLPFVALLAVCTRLRNTFTAVLLTRDY